MSSILIQNVRLVHAAQTDASTSDIYVDNGVIVGIDAAPSGFNADECIDGEGRLLSFALADLAVRLQEKGGNHRDNMADVLNAAVAGGSAA